MRKIIEVVRDLKAMGYHKNDAASGGKDYNKHEDAVEEILKSRGFALSEKTKVSQRNRDEILEHAGKDIHNLMADGEYIPQPCGTHNSPDFMVKEAGVIHMLECKSVKGKSKSPVYNSGVPKSGFIYIFSAEREGKTTLFLGDDVCGPETKKVICDTKEEIDRILALANKKMGATPDNRAGLTYYDRKMLNHTVNGQHYREVSVETRNW